MEIYIEPVKAFSTQDANDVRSLILKLGTRSKPLSDEDWHELVESPVTTVLAVRDEEKHIIGMVTVAVYRIPYLRKAYLDDLIVDETYRGKGIGTKLLEAAVEFAREKGAAYIDFTSHPSRVKANELYEKLGFKKKESNTYRLAYDYGKN
jgi:ribosomal protein S18 acetylase RimI-like enzyme